MHGKRRYVKLAQIAMAGAALASASPAGATEIYSGQVDGAKVAARPGLPPLVAYALGPNVEFWMPPQPQPGRGFRNPTPALGFPSDVELDGLALTPLGRWVVLGRARDGTWLQLWNDRRYTIHRDSKQARFGPAGLALDRAGRPVVAYVLWYPETQKSFLRVARIGPSGVLRVQPVTKEGFPRTATMPSATPVVLASGEVRAVETYRPAAIDWGLTGWGKLLFSSALGVPTGQVAAYAAGSTLYAAWTVAFPTLGPPAVMLATRSDRVRTGIAVENAVLAALAAGPAGPEIAANRCLDDGICIGLVNGVGVDGIVADYGALGDERHLVLRRPEALEAYAVSAPLAPRLTFNADLTGRVDGATSGAVTIYRELPGVARAVFTTAQLAADGTFAVPAPLTPVAWWFRAVWTDPATGIPYAALTGP